MVVPPNDRGAKVGVVESEDEDVQAVAIKAKATATAAIWSRLVKGSTSPEESELYDRTAGF